MACRRLDYCSNVGYNGRKKRRNQSRIQCPFDSLFIRKGELSY